MINWFKKQPLGFKIMIGIGAFFILCAVSCCGNLIYTSDRPATIQIKDTPTSTPGKGEVKQLNETSKSDITKEPDETKESDETKEIKAPFEIITNKEGLKITITKITNDDMLKIYITYENNTGLPIDLSESCSKIVADGKQQEWDFDINYDLNPNIIYDLESDVTYDSIVAFKKIKDNKFNLVFSCEYDDYRINNIIVK